MRHITQYSLALMLIAAGCAGSHKVDIGEGHEPTAVSGESLSDYAGVWDGYAEAFTWNDGTDHVRITLDSQGMGTLEIGEADPLPPPDPEHGYPPGDNNPNAKLAIANIPLIISGFGYPVHGARVESKRIRFTTATRTLYKDWCEMQTSYLDVGAWPTHYACVTGLGWSGPEDAPMCTAYNGRDSSNPDNAEPVDCGQASTCIAFCECTETSCSVSPTDDVRSTPRLTTTASRSKARSSSARRAS